MRLTGYLKLALYDPTDTLSITGEENSLNRNMELLDQETMAIKNALETVTRQLTEVQQALSSIQEQIENGSLGQPEAPAAAVLGQAVLDSAKLG